MNSWISGVMARSSSQIRYAEGMVFQAALAAPTLSVAKEWRLSLDFQ
jgi:hypothetical protein